MTLVSVLKPTSHESRPGMPMPPLTPSRGAAAEDVLRHVRRRLLDALHPGELDRLVLGYLPGRGVADAELDRCHYRGQRQRNQQAEAVMTVAPAAQHAHRVDGGHEESRDHVRREDHVGCLVRDCLG